MFLLRCKEIKLKKNLNNLNQHYVREKPGGPSK